MPFALWAFFGGVGAGWWATNETVEATTGTGSNSPRSSLLLLVILVAAAWYAYKRGLLI